MSYREHILSCPYTRQCPGYLTRLTVLIITTITWSRYNTHTHFADKESEAQSLKTAQVYPIPSDRHGMTFYPWPKPLPFHNKNQKQCYGLLLILQHRANVSWQSTVSISSLWVGVGGGSGSRWGEKDISQAVYESRLIQWYLRVSRKMKWFSIHHA